MRTKKNRPGKTYIGMDNGVSGSIGIIASYMDPLFFITPTFSSLDYTKEAKNTTRIAWRQLESIIPSDGNRLVLLERPMVNPGRFTATKTALRALEASLIVFEMTATPYLFIDSKEWQKDMLPRNIKGTDALKKASLDIGIRLFPQFKHLFKGDADGILIAEWARRKGL